MKRPSLLLICVGLTCFANGCRVGREMPVTQCDWGACGVVRCDTSGAQGDPGMPSPGAGLSTAGSSNSSSEAIGSSFVAKASFLKRDDGVANQNSTQLTNVSQEPTSPTESRIQTILSPAGQSRDPRAESQTMTQPLSPTSLTIDQAEEIAISRNPNLVKARAAIDSLRGKYLQSGLRPNPQVGYISADVGEEGTAGQQGAFFSQEIVRGGKLRLNRSIVCQEIEAARQQLEIDRQKLLTEVRQRFYDLLVAQERVRVVERFRNLSQDAVSTSNKLFEEQEISKIANLRARIQGKNIAIIVEQAQVELTAATRSLAAATGLGQPDQIQAGDIVVETEIYPQVPNADPQTSFQTILSGSPELAQATAELERARWNLNRQVVEPIRNVQVQTSFSHGNVSGDDLVGVQVGVPLRINDRNQGNIASARSEISVQIQNIESIQRDLSQRFSIAWRDYENARVQFEKYQFEIIPESSMFYEMVALAFKEGELGYLDLVAAQQTYLDASLQNLDALRQFWQASALIDGYLLSEN